MENQKPKVFADGFSFKRNDNAPEFVVGRQSIKVDEAMTFLQTNQKNGWVNIDIKRSQKGTYYCELDTWEAKPQGGNVAPAPVKAAPVPAQAEPDLPF
jgi:hypothetical protein|tara:strand:+ start:4949 stop:5242 length:294 start_codon:yes stop_codon:yes gene_type:complete